MIQVHETSLWTLLEAVAGTKRTETLFRTLEVHPGLLQEEDGKVHRAVLAQAMNMLLFEDLLRRVPAGEAYVLDAVAAGQKITFDHGALRTVAAPCGMLPAGKAAFARILEPLGFEVAGRYPLDRLSMTGFAYAQQDFPEAIAQFFVSELHVEKFSAAFQAAAARVVSTSADPLPEWAKGLLDVLQLRNELPFEQAVRLLPNLVVCFDRQHEVPTEADYETLLAESAEMAWISTEGNAFNHATDRVEDVVALAEAQKALSRPMKAAVEFSASGRVIQTAFRAAMVERAFVSAEGHRVLRTVPGSFYEFITRREDQGALDLRFDSSNAQGIFKMTAAAAGEC